MMAGRGIFVSVFRWRPNPTLDENGSDCKMMSERYYWTFDIKSTRSV